MATPEIKAGIRFPGWTLLILGSALLIYVVPGLSAFMIYDRNAILDGEIWRLVTGHWVHISVSQLFFDLAALGIAGWLIESRGLRGLPILCLLVALLTGAVLFLALPGMQYYGGLSGVATGAIVYLALHGLKGPAPLRWGYLVLLLLIVGKSIAELIWNHAFFVPVTDMPLRPISLAHVVGALAGAFFALIQIMKERKKSEGIRKKSKEKKEKGSKSFYISVDHVPRG